MKNNNYHFTYNSICNVCVGVNSSLIGTCDPCPTIELKETVEWLEYRLNNWTDPFNKSYSKKTNDVFDFAVRELVRAAIKIGKEELVKRNDL